MLFSEQINELAKALAIAQSKFKPLVKNKKANYGKFADLDACFDATSEQLSTVGIARFQGVDNGQLVTRLVHSSGQWAQNSVPLCGDLSTMQKLGSAITYGKRYGYQAMVGISAEEDDDGEHAKGKSKPVQKPISDQEELAQEIMAVGKYTGKTMVQVLAEDSANGFRLAKWVSTEYLADATKLHPCYLHYLEYARSEGVEV